MQDIQLLVLDIDGTIAGQSNEVRPLVIQAIQAAQARGVQVAVATGRMYQSALRFHTQVGSTLPLIAYQGAWIQNPKSDRPQRHLPLTLAQLHFLLDYLAVFGTDLSVHLYSDDQLYVREILPETQEYALRAGVTPIALGDLRSLQTPPTKLLALSPDTELITKILAQLKSKVLPQDLYLTTSASTFLEATHPDGNKGDAVRYLAEEVLNLNADQVMTLGDNCNDLEMLQYAGIGVAMGSAPSQVKAIADWIAPDVEMDGVAIAIEKFLLS